MPAQISNEATLANGLTNAELAVQAAPSVTLKVESAPEDTASRMRLDMNEILGLKRN